MSDIHFIIRPQSGINIDITPNVMRTSLQAGISGIAASDRTYTSGNVIFSGQNNITIGTSSNGVSQWIRMSVANAAGQTYQPIAFSGSNTSLTASTLSFGNSNSISHYITNGSIVASFSQSTHAHDYIPLASSTRSVGVNTLSTSTGGSDLKFSFNSSGATFSVPKWLTTAAQVSHSHGDISTIVTAGSVLTVNSASNGLTLAVPAWITTAAGGASWELEGANTSGTTGSAFSTLFLEGGNNITLSGNSNTIKFSVANAAGQSYQPVAFSGSNTSTTASTISFGNSNNISHYITNGSLVASMSESTHAHSFVNQINGSSGSISFNTGSSLSSSVNNSGITLGLASDISTAWSGQTTANQSRVIQINGSSGSISFNTASSLSSSANASGITFGLASNISTAWSGQTTANQSRVIQINGSSGSISFNTGSSLSSSVNASGITFGLASDISTAWSGQTTANQSRVIQLNGSSGSLTISASDNITVSNSAGTIFIKGASGGGGSWELEGTKTAGTTGTTFNTLFLEAGNNITLSGNSNTIRFSVGDYVNASDTGSVYFNNSNGFSWGSTTGVSSTTITGDYAAIKNLVLSGTTTGTMATISSGTMTLAGGSNITLSQVGNAVTIIGASGGTGAGGAAIRGSGTYTQNSGTVQFQTGNGMTFGLSSDGVMTASYTVPSGSVYFTNGSNVTWDSSVSGVSTSIMLTAGGGTGAGGGLSGSNTSQSLGTITFGSSNNMHFYFTNSSLVGSFVESTHAHSFVNQINGSSGSISLNTGSSLSSSANASGITFGLASNISTDWSGQTTANQSRVIVFNGSSGNISFVTGSGMSTTTNASTLTFGLRSDISTAWSGQTTANQSRVIQINGSSGSISFNTGSSLSSSANASGITFGLASNITSALQSAGAYLTTAAQVSHTHGNISLSLTNLSGTYSSASNGLTISLTAVNSSNFINTSESGNLYFSNGSGISWGSSVSCLSTTLTGSIATTYAGTGFTSTSTSGTALGATLNTSGLSMAIPAWLTAGGTGGGAALKGSGTYSQNTGTIEFANSNSVTFGLTAGTMTASVGRGNVYFTNGSNITWDSSVDGVSTSIMATAGGGTGAGGGLSGSNTSQSLGTITFGSSNNMHFYFTNSSLVGSFSESTHAHSFVNQINGSSGSISFNTASSLSSSANASGITFGLASNISTAWSGQTTANQSRVLDFNGSSGQISFVTGSGMSTTTNASTLTFGLRSDISTAWSGQTTANASKVIQINGSSGSFSFATGSSLSSSANASTITWGLASNISTAWSGQTTANQSRVIQLNASSGSLTLSASSNITISNDASTIKFSVADAIPLGSSTRSAGINTSVSTAYAGSTLAFSANSSGITMSVPAWITTYTPGGAQTGISGLAGSNTTYSSGTVILSGEANITIHTSVDGASQYLRISGGAGGAENNYIYLYGNTSNLSSTSGSTISLSGGTNITLAQSGGSIKIEGPSGNVYMQNASGISWSTSAGGISTSISAAFNATGSTITTTSGTDAKMTLNTAGLNLALPIFVTNAYSASNQLTATFAQVSHTHGNVSIGQTNISVSGTTASNGLSLDFSVAAPGGGAAISAAGSSQNAGTIVFSNSNSVSFGMNVSTITASVGRGNVYFQDASGVSWSSSVDSLSTSITASINAATGWLIDENGGTASGTTTGTFIGNQLRLFAGDNITLSGNGPNGAISIFGTSGGGGGGAALQGSGTYSQNTGTVQFANSNGITFGLSNNGTMTAQHNGLYQIRLTGNTEGGSSYDIINNVVFLNGGNNVTLSANGSTINFSAGDIVTLYDGTNSITNGTARFSNSNGISFGFNGQTITGSHNGFVSTSQFGGTFMQTSGSSKYAQAWSLVGNNTAGTTTQVISQTLYFSGDNMITISGGTGSVIKFSLNSASLLGTGATQSFLYTSVSSKFPIGWSLGTSTGGSTSGTTTQNISNSLYLVAGSNINLSGSGSSIVINAIPSGSVYFADIVGFSWTSTTAANATTFALKIA